MRKETSVGVRAGAIGGVLFVVFDLLLVFMFWYGRFDWLNAFVRMFAERGLSVSVQFVFVGAIIGFALAGLLFAGVGAVLGMIFVRIKDRLPTTSTYFKALSFGIILVVLTSVPRLVREDTSEMYVVGANLYAMLLCSPIFAYLFNRWTK